MARMSRKRVWPSELLNMKTLGTFWDVFSGYTTRLVKNFWLLINALWRIKTCTWFYYWKFGVWYYQIPTFWQSNTLWFVSLNTKGFWPRNFSGSCLNYLMHESWFLFDENPISFCYCRKGDHLLTKCHRMSHPATHQIQSPTSDRRPSGNQWENDITL